MSKVSMAKAAKLFAVSRPTLLKHLNQGKITGEKEGEAWRIDVAELARIYKSRDAGAAPTAPPIIQPTSQSTALKESELQGEIRVLQAKLDAAERLIEERGKHLDDLRKRLSVPDPVPDSAGRRRWWPF